MFTHVRRTLLAVSTYIALAQGLTAANGLTLIDQKAALAGKVTPHDAAGFPVTIYPSLAATG